MHCQTVTISLFRSKKQTGRNKLNNLRFSCDDNYRVFCGSAYNRSQFTYLEVCVQKLDSRIGPMSLALTLAAFGASSCGGSRTTTMTSWAEFSTKLNLSPGTALNPTLTRYYSTENSESRDRYSLVFLPVAGIYSFSLTTSVSSRDWQVRSDSPGYQEQLQIVIPAGFRSLKVQLALSEEKNSGGEIVISSTQLLEGINILNPFSTERITQEFLERLK